MKQEVVTPGFAKKVENEIGTLNSKLTWQNKKTVSGATEFAEKFRHNNSSATINVNEAIRMVYFDCWAYTTAELQKDVANTVIDSSGLLSQYKPNKYNAVSIAVVMVNDVNLVLAYAFIRSDINVLSLVTTANIPAGQYIRIIMQYTY